MDIHMTEVFDAMVMSYAVGLYYNCNNHIYHIHVYPMHSGLKLHRGPSTSG